MRVHSGRVAGSHAGGKEWLLVVCRDLYTHNLSVHQRNSGNTWGNAHNLEGHNENWITYFFPLSLSFSLSEYEAMESYSAQSEDEVTFKTGDTIQVLSKSLDGWWKIRYVYI